MHQAITTKYLGPTDYRGARVKAQAQAGAVTVNWDHALNPEANHRAAAMALASKYGWTGQWVVGALPDSNPAYAAFVNVGGDYGDGFTLNAESAQ